MEISVRELKNRLSEFLREARAGREVTVISRGQAVARLVAPRPARRIKATSEAEAVAPPLSQPWTRPGNAELRLPRIMVRLKPGKKTPSEIVSEEVG